MIAVYGIGGIGFSMVFPISFAMVKKHQLTWWLVLKALERCFYGMEPCHTMFGNTSRMRLTLNVGYASIYQHMQTYETGTKWCPPSYVCWFINHSKYRYHPLINPKPSEMGLINQLIANYGAPPCTNIHWWKPRSTHRIAERSKRVPKRRYFSTGRPLANQHQTWKVANDLRELSINGGSPVWMLDFILFHGTS